LISWLEEQTVFPKLFWQDRDTQNITVAAGATDILHEIPTNASQMYFGGTAFSSRRKDTVWKEFPPTYFFSPKTVLSGKVDPSPLILSKPFKRIDTPDFSRWEQKVAHALQRIERKEIDKVVIGRRTTLQFKDLINPLEIVRSLLSKTKHATLFCLQLAPHLAFVGATPEKLYVRKGDLIFTEACAGTIPLDSGKHTEKDRREFAFVKQFIHAELSPLCTSYAWEEDSVIKTAFVEHLYNRFSGTLKEASSDAHLIELLHPTPAIAGFPRTPALRHIEENEPFERGWYASPLGWIGPGEANFAVGIRSALISGKEMHLFASAGIVRGSNPKKEWEELNLKIRSYHE
jgi:menaquinone-specific isochorismate synthase